MPITEHAALRLLPPHTTSSPLLHKHLRTAKSAMESYSSLPIHYYTCLEDDGLIYILGQWASLAQHMEGFIPSAANQEVLKDLEGVVRVETFFHVDVDGKELPLDADVLAVGRMKVKEGRGKGFTALWGEVKGYLVDAAKGVGAGWRIEKEEVEGRVREEWVVFSGWESREEHLGFAETEGFKEYRRIMEEVEGAEVRHLVKFDIEA